MWKLIRPDSASSHSISKDDTPSIRKTHKVMGGARKCMKTGGIGAELIALITEHCFDDSRCPKPLRSPARTSYPLQTAPRENFDDYSSPIRSFKGRHPAQTRRFLRGTGGPQGWFALILALASLPLLPGLLASFSPLQTGPRPARRQASSPCR